MAGAAHTWGHDELARDLAGYLSGPQVMIWTDMQLGPSGSPRPDVYLLRKSYSKPLPLAFECKISRSDLRSDTTSGKWQTYLKYAAGVVFAVPDGLCTDTDIPPGCGFIVRKAREWRYARRPTLAKVTVPFDACMKLLIDGVERTYRTPEPRPRRVALYAEHKAVRQKFGEAVALAARDMAEAQERLGTIKAQAAAAWKHEEAQIRARAEALKKSLQGDTADLEKMRSELAQILGLPEGTRHTWAFQQALRDLRTNLNADARVQATERRLKATRQALENALAAMPEPVAEVPAMPAPWPGSVPC